MPKKPKKTKVIVNPKKDQIMSEESTTIRQLIAQQIADLKEAAKKLDPVGKEDKAIDNDGDHDKSDKYLLNKRKTISEYVRLYEKDIKPNFGNLLINSITKADVKDWFDNLSLRSKYTANRCLTILRTVFELAIDYEYVNQNPTTRIKKHTELIYKTNTRTNIGSDISQIHLKK